MFDVSTLLLDDARNPPTPLTNGAINGTPRCGATGRVDWQEH